ncbi:MAG: hypothetical protein RL549_192 [Verrucomicrobiota bacterium]|jgi:autotransporter-associated beta strand protein
MTQCLLGAKFKILKANNLCIIFKRCNFPVFGIFQGNYGTLIKVKITFVHIFRVMNSRSVRSCQILLIGFAFCLQAPAEIAAATITPVGIEEGSGANGYSPQNWSNPGVAKSYDLAGEKYGTAGYYQIRPMPWDPGAASLGEAVGAGNDIGITAGSNPSLYSVPVFLGSITGGAGTYVNYGGYTIARGPDGAALYRQGAISVSVNEGPYNTPSGSDTGYFGSAFSFTTGTNNMVVDFRIGVGVDGVGSGTYAPDYVSLYSSSTGTVYSSQLSRNGSMDIAFFDVTAGDGETISAAVWQLAGSNSVVPFNLITFDVARYKFDVASGTQTNSVALGGSPSALVKTGDGTLVMNASNNYGGGTLISAGTLKLAGGSVTGNITNNGSLVISTDLANAVSGTGFLTKVDAGNATLWSANSYTGATVVEGGQLRLDGSGAISGNSVVQIASGAGFSATGVFKTSNNLTIAGLTGEGEFYNADGNLTVNQASGTSVFSGQIKGGTSLTKQGIGSLALSGSNSYAAFTAVNEGRLVVAHGHALGSPNAGTTVANGAQLRLNAADNGFIIGNETLTISGHGLAGSLGGALRNAVGDNTYQGPITLAADATIGAAGGTSLTLNVNSGDAIDFGGFNLTFDGAGTVQVNDPMIGTGQISKIGSGDLVIEKSDLTATIKANSIAVVFTSAPTNGTYAVLPGSLAVASLASSSVTGLGSGKTATIANSPNLVVQVSDAVTGPTFVDAYPGIDMTDVAPNGLTYLVNYAFGGSSTTEAKLPEQITSDPAQLTLVAYVRTNDPSVNVAPERGESLANWSGDFITTNYLADPSAPAGTEKRSYSTPISTNNPRMFLRLKATHGH